MNTTEPKHIILADDDSDHAFLFGRILAKTYPGITLTIAKNGAELLELLQTLRPAMVFLDLHMPCKNGIECLTEIRNTPELQHLPIVVYSSSSKMTDIQRSYLHQADLYMVKPFHSEHLENALESVLRMDLKDPNHSRNHYFINNRFVPFTAHNM
jgi:CheY-like chemotaxis protein